MRKVLKFLMLFALMAIVLPSCNHPFWEKQKEVPVEKTDTIVAQNEQARQNRLAERAVEIQERTILDTYYSIPDIAFMAVLMKVGEDASKVAIVEEYNDNKVYYDGIVLASLAQKGMESIKNDSIVSVPSTAPLPTVSTPKK